MIALLSLVFGFLSAFIKPLLEYFKDKQDKNHELEMTKLQIQNNRDNLNAKLEEVRLERESADLITRYLPVKQSNLAAIINEVTKTVIALTLITLYCLINWSYHQQLSSLSDANFYAMNMWTDEDYAFIGAIVGHYFGNLVKGLKSV